MIATTTIDGDVDNKGDDDTYIFSKTKMKASPAETGLTTSAFPDLVSTTVTAPLLLSKLPKHMQSL